MIVFPAALVLAAEAAGQPLSNPRIGYQTHLRDLAASAVVASTEAAGAPGDAVLREDTAEYWEPTALPATLTIDMGGAKSVDYVGLAGHTLGSARVAVEVETSTDGGTYTGFSSGELMPADDAPLLFLDEAVTARWLRLTFSGSGTVMPRLPVVYAGEMLAFPQPVTAGFRPPNFSRETELKAAMTRGGQFLGQHYRRFGVSGAVNFTDMSESFYRDEFEPFVKAARSFPYFFAWCPERFPLEVVYAWTEENIAPEYVRGIPLMSASVPMRGIGHE